MPPIKKGNRKYKKGIPFRDARKFILICEGEREAEYFDYFDKKSQKLIVKTIAPIGVNKGKSAPNHLQERASEYIDENGWDNEFEDQLWFVLDVDKWERSSIEELYQLTEQTDNWYIGISNHCFEVWLYYHKDGTKVIPNNSTHMKQLLNNQVKGGYKIEIYAPDIEIASINSEKNDINKTGYFPDIGVTKLYVLGKEIVNLLKHEEGILKI
jgi:hypothetical protein